jgi:hypothetical protein
MQTNRVEQVFYVKLDFSPKAMFAFGNLSCNFSFSKIKRNNISLKTKAWVFSFTRAVIS